MYTCEVKIASVHLGIGGVEHPTGNAMIDYKYNDEKAAQVIAQFLRLSGGQNDMRSLLKLAYLANREAFKRWHTPLVPDKYVSMRQGPVLSFSYDNLKRLTKSTNESWHNMSGFSEAPWNFDIVLQDDNVDDGELSRREIRLIEETWAKFGSLSSDELVDFCHKLPEWKDPGKSSKPIDVEEILRNLGIDEDTMIEIADEERAYQLEHQLLSR